MTFPARERWRRLPRDTERDEYFRVLQEAITEFYLADPANPYQQSGRSSGAQRWEDTRRGLLKAIHRSGDFMDIGCANGLLLETLIAWAGEEGLSLRPNGIDLVPELIDLARQRFPGREDSFEVANAFYWSPRRTYDFVRTNLEIRSRTGLDDVRAPTVRSRCARWSAHPVPLLQRGGTLCTRASGSPHRPVIRSRAGSKSPGYPSYGSNGRPKRQPLRDSTPAHTASQATDQRARRRGEG